MQDNRLFKQEINADIYILAGTNDDVVPTEWVLEFAKAQQATIKFLHDDHSLTININQIPSMVMNIIGKKH
jgi:dienelactone hydrolase